MGVKTVYDSSLTAVADAIRAKTGKTDTMQFPDGFVDEIEGISGGGGITPPEPVYWVKPQGTPDLDALLEADEHDNVIYMIVDNVHHKDNGVSVNISNPVAYVKHFERGHVENGVFVVDEQVTFNHNQNQFIYQDMSDPWEDYPVFRAYADNGENIASINVQNAYDHYLEVVLRSNKTFGVFIPRYIKRMRIDAPIRSMDTGGGANSLQKLTLSDTSNVTTFQNFLLDCKHLSEVNIAEWDVRNSTSFYRCFEGMQSIKSIDCSAWQNSLATSLVRMFQNCTALEEIRFGSGFTPAPTNISDMFVRCYALQKITFPPLDLSQNTGNMHTMFSDCYSLAEIDGAEYLDTATIANNNYPSFATCLGMRKLPDGYVWDLSGGTSVSSGAFNNPMLEELDLSGTLHTENIRQPPLVSNALQLKKIDYHGWDTSGITGFGVWTVLSKVKYLNLDGWDLTHLTSVSMWNVQSVEEFYPPKIAVSHGYSNMINLDHASRLRILNVLPEVSSTVTLTLGNVKNELTDAEIAIATQKGWTVA